ncbi:glutamate-1-semialdehyde 2,1-aminomutase [Rhodobacteraceae bacterium (ex Bugula neritina AB1)]|nr:glutamate-1-semialdehyde 2,1-aminomutase [Rhodobacteraceae bacterium (ex Bugula neritina AB1)]
MSEATLPKNLTLDAALSEAEENFAARNVKSGENYNNSTLSMPGGNTRTVIHFSPFPLTFSKAEGATLTDADGNEYTDFMGEYTAALYGHSEPAITAAVEKALHQGIVRGGANDNEAAFSAAICDRFPAIDRVRFCNSGTEANLYALRTACSFTGRSDVIVMKAGYHGGVLYFGGECPLNVPMPFHPVTYNDTEEAVAKIRELGSKLAAVILEPMLGGGGCIPATAEFLQALRAETEKSGALLIFDEVMTSRLAPGGLHGQHNIKPDMVTLGKYVGGGMSFGAFGGREDIMARFDPRIAGHWPHAGTFNNNALTMAAGLAGLTQVYTADRVEAFNAIGDGLRAKMQDAIAGAGVPMCVTGLGSMAVFHFGTGPITTPGDAVAAPEALKAILHLDMIERGFYYARRGMIALCLPTTDEDTTRFASAFGDVLSNRASLIHQAVKG